ncbi:MAG: LPS export ABC transporter ATP-binding protein [Planctomycetes bacterium]|nr:LPS export ABC transporter ATP-binding protein [Planctomycetota bacterium]
MLRVRGLKKSFRVGGLPFGGATFRSIVQGVDLDVEQGEIVGLLGANGAGKTTTFRMTMGMFRPDEGSVRFLDDEVTDWPMYRRARAGMGYLAQEHSEFKDLTTEQNLLVVLERLPLSRADRRRRCDALLDEYGLTPTRDQLARTLSGGQKRRLEVARLLITEPRLVLFDEPWHGVDPIARSEIQAIVFGLRDRGISVFITDHDVERVLLTVDRVYLMNEGKIIVHGAPQAIVDSEEARRVYLGQDFQLDLPDRPARPGGVEDAA